MDLKNLDRKDLNRLLDETQRKQVVLEKCRKELLDITAIKPLQEFESGTSGQMDLFKHHNNKQLKTSRDLAVEKLQEVVTDLERVRILIGEIRAELKEKLIADGIL